MIFFYDLRAHFHWPLSSSIVVTDDLLIYSTAYIILFIIYIAVLEQTLYSIDLYKLRNGYSTYSCWCLNYSYNKLNLELVITSSHITYSQMRCVSLFSEHHRNDKLWAPYNITCTTVSTVFTDDKIDIIL